MTSVAQSFLSLLEEATREDLVVWEDATPKEDTHKICPTFSTSVSSYSVSVLVVAKQISFVDDNFQWKSEGRLTVDNDFVEMVRANSQRNCPSYFRKQEMLHKANGALSELLTKASQTVNPRGVSNES